MKVVCLIIGIKRIVKPDILITATARWGKRSSSPHAHHIVLRTAQVKIIAHIVHVA